MMGNSFADHFGCFLFVPHDTHKKRKIEVFFYPFEGILSSTPWGVREVM